MFRGWFRSSASGANEGQHTPGEIGCYTVRVYLNKGTEVSIDYEGRKLRKDGALYVRGVYASQLMFAASNHHLTAYILSTIAKGCLHLQDETGLDIASAVAVSVISSGRALVERYKTVYIRVFEEPGSDRPSIAVEVPDELSFGDMIASVAAFNEVWLRTYCTDVDDLSIHPFLLFFAGFIDYYDSDVLAFQDEQSTFQAPMKGWVYAHSKTVGLWGLHEE